MTVFACRVLNGDVAARSALLDRMLAEGLADATLYDVPAVDFRETWTDITSPDTAWLVEVRACTVRPGGDTATVAAIAWLNNFTGRTAMLHFCVFRDFQAQAAPMGRHLLRWVFGSGHFDSLVGLTPAPYRHALRLARAMGFTPAGRVPGACHLVRRGRHVDGVLSVRRPLGERTARVLRMATATMRRPLGERTARVLRMATATICNPNDGERS